MQVDHDELGGHAALPRSAVHLADQPDDINQHVHDPEKDAQFVRDMIDKLNRLGLDIYKTELPDDDDPRAKNAMGQLEQFFGIAFTYGAKLYDLGRKKKLALALVHPDHHQQASPYVKEQRDHGQAH